MPTKLTDNEIQKLIQLAQKTQWDYKLSLYETDALTRINKSVKKVSDSITKKLKTISPDAIFSTDRMNALSDEMNKLTGALQSQISNQIADTAGVAGAASYTAQSEIASFGGLVPNFNNVALSAAQMKSLVTTTPIGGKKLNQWVEKSFSYRLQDKFKSDIISGMLLGESYPNMLKRFNKGIYSDFAGDMEGLTRTYVQSVNVNAMNEVMKANDDIVKGWKWSSVAENHTCVRCLSLDSAGIVYPINGGPEMPLHLNCRCFKDIITKTFKELGVNIEEVKENFKPYTIRGKIDPITGKLTPGKIGIGGNKTVSVGRFLGSYDNFFESLPKQVQVQMLGPTRHGLWKSGMPLSDFTTKDGRQKLIKELI